MKKRVVVTGMGAVCPLGANISVIWERLISGTSGVRRLDDTIVHDVPCKIGGVVPSAAEDPLGGFRCDEFIDSKDQRKMDRFIQFAIVASQQALLQANWTPKDELAQQRTATIIATGIGGFHSITNAIETVRDRGARRLSPFTVPSFLANLAAGWVSIINGFKGPLAAPVTACAASVQAIGDAARLIRNDEADVAVCGGAEACISRVSLGGFAAARALSTAYNDTPAAASRPFDNQRDGFVMGEGAGILVLESEEHAKARGAKILAEVLGYGTSADAYHLTAGPENGEGALRSMRQALREGQIDPHQVDHLNAHSTSTPLGDRGELAAIKALFGSNGRVGISATKSATGHLLGAAGGIEAIFSILSILNDVMPPTLNLGSPDPIAEGLHLVGKMAESREVKVVLSNGFGFGGVNASLLLGRA